jgi:hypothetical protein
MITKKNDQGIYNPKTKRFLVNFGDNNICLALYL